MNGLHCIVLARVQPKKNVYFVCHIHMEMAVLQQNLANFESAENSASFIGTGLDDLCMNTAAPYAYISCVQYLHEQCLSLG